MVRGGVSPNNPTYHYLTSCMIMTASDLSDQTKDWVNAKKIAELVYNEFFTQGDLEKAMGNKPVESMDREKAFIPSLQIQFLDFIVIPVYRLEKAESLLILIVYTSGPCLTWMRAMSVSTRQS